jgi:hypothetical protein
MNHRSGRIKVNAKGLITRAKPELIRKRPGRNFFCIFRFQIVAISETGTLFTLLFYVSFDGKSVFLSVTLLSSNKHFISASSTEQKASRNRSTSTNCKALEMPKPTKIYRFITCKFSVFTSFRKRMLIGYSSQ